VACGGDKAFPTPDKLRPSFARCLHGTFDNGKNRFPLSSHVQPVKAFFENVKGSIRRVDFESFFFTEIAYPHVNASGQEMKPDPVIPLPRHGRKLDFRAVVQTEVIPSPKMDFGPANPGD